MRCSASSSVSRASSYSSPSRSVIARDLSVPISLSRSIPTSLSVAANLLKLRLKAVCNRLEFFRRVAGLREEFVSDVFGDLENRIVGRQLRRLLPHLLEDLMTADEV